MSRIFHRISGTSATIASGAAASAIGYTFTDKDSPCRIIRVFGTTPNYTNAVNTTLFICQGSGTGASCTVMWSGTATAKAIARNEPVTGAGKEDGVLVFPGDTIQVVAAGDIGATGANTMAISAHTVQG